MSDPNHRDVQFERALRTGPNRVDPSIGFAQRMENSWRHAPPEVNSEWATQWRDLLSDLRAPTIAFAALAMLVVLFRAAPQISQPTTFAVAAQPTVADPGDAFTGGSFATLRTSLEGVYSEESRLMVEDTTRAIRFAASQILPPEILARAEKQGWFSAKGSQDG